jgi:DNA-binding MarR family transcriptional regulator
MRGPEDDRARAIELTRIGQAEAAELREAFQAELDSLWRN